MSSQPNNTMTHEHRNTATVNITWPQPSRCLHYTVPQILRVSNNSGLTSYLSLFQTSQLSLNLNLWFTMTHNTHLGKILANKRIRPQPINFYDQQNRFHGKNMCWLIFHMIQLSSAWRWWIIRLYAWLHQPHWLQLIDLLHLPVTENNKD